MRMRSHSITENDVLQYQADAQRWDRMEAISLIVRKKLQQSM